MPCLVLIRSGWHLVESTDVRKLRVQHSSAFLLSYSPAFLPTYLSTSTCFARDIVLQELDNKRQADPGKKSGKKNYGCQKLW